MLPHSQQQQNLRNIRRLNPLSPSCPRRLGSWGREGGSPEDFARSSQSGFTIIEALFAIVVVTILMAAVAPVLVLATANRVQGRRVEMAVNAAKSYIDRVRTDPSLTPPLNSNSVYRSSATYFNSIGAPRSGGTLFCDATNPSTKGYCTAPLIPNSKLFCVDGTGDGYCRNDNFKDMIVQAFGYQANPNASQTDEQRAAKGYVLGIRVYRADAFKDSVGLQKSTNQTKAQASTNTAGLGNRKAPLVEMTTQIITSDTKYQDLQDQLNRSGS